MRKVVSRENPPHNKFSVERSSDYLDRPGRYQRPGYDHFHQPEAPGTLELTLGPRKFVISWWILASDWCFGNAFWRRLGVQKPVCFCSNSVSQNGDKSSEFTRSLTENRTGMLFSDSEKPTLTLDFQVHSCSEVISIYGSGSGLGELPRSEKISDGLNIVGLGLGTPYNSQIEPLWPDTKIVSLTYPQVVFSISGFI